MNFQNGRHFTLKGYVAMYIHIIVMFSHDFLKWPPFYLKWYTVMCIYHLSFFFYDFHYICVFDSTKINKNLHLIHVLKSKTASKSKMATISPENSIGSYIHLE